MIAGKFITINDVKHAKMESYLHDFIATHWIWFLIHSTKHFLYIEHIDFHFSYRLSYRHTLNDKTLNIFSIYFCTL